MIVEGGTPYTVSGTSVAAPSMAGILALAVQKAGVRQGSVNARLYQLAASTPAAFHPTLSGSNTVPGVSGHTAAGATYNLATGLGSVDGAALVQNWSVTSSLVQCSAAAVASTGCLLSTPIHIGVGIAQFQ
jgi:subtilase family serine protease